MIAYGLRYNWIFIFKTFRTKLDFLWVFFLTSWLNPSDGYCVGNIQLYKMIVLNDYIDYQPSVVSAFAPQIACICQHPNLDEYDLNSVVSIVTGGSTINEIF